VGLATAGGLAEIAAGVLGTMATWVASTGSSRAAGREAQTPRLVGACERQARVFLGGALRCLTCKESPSQKKMRCLAVKKHSPEKSGGEAAGCKQQLLTRTRRGRSSSSKRARRASALLDLRAAAAAPAALPVRKAQGKQPAADVPAAEPAGPRPGVLGHLAPTTRGSWQMPVGCCLLAAAYCLLHAESRIQFEAGFLPGLTDLVGEGSFEKDGSGRDTAVTGGTGLGDALRSSWARLQGHPKIEALRDWRTELTSREY
jgi:hypothetical protein